MISYLFWTPIATKSTLQSYFRCRQFVYISYYSTVTKIVERLNHYLVEEVIIMLFSNCKKTSLSVLFFLLNLSFSGSFTYATTPPSDNTDVAEISPELIQQQREIWENQLKITLDQFNALDLILEDLALVIHNDSAKVTNKRIVLEEIKNIRSLIEEVKKDSFINLDPVVLSVLQNVLTGVINHTSQALSAGFKTLPPFDLVLCMNRSKPIDFETLDIDKDLEASKLAVASLDKQAKNVGLSWYNKAYRKLDDWVIQPTSKSKLLQSSGKVIAVSSFLAWYFLWFHSDRGQATEDRLPSYTDITTKIISENPHLIGNIDTINKLAGEELARLKAACPTYYSWENWLRKKVGSYADVGVNGLKTMPGERHHNGRNALGSLGKFEEKWTNIDRGAMPLGKYLMAGFAYSMFKDKLTLATDWASKRIENAHNGMRGGAFKKTANDNEVMIEPKVKFDDLVGMDHAKDVLSMIVKYIEDPERWDRSKLTPEKGYLLTGPTRTGKSFIAEALAGEIREMMKTQGRNPDDFKFFVIKSSFIKQHGIANVLNMAKNESPCVLFIDEIDLLRLQRASGDTDLLNEFLVAMSGCLESDPKKQVIVLAATNKPENMDEALKQRGRFGKEIRFEYPSFNDRKSFLTKRLSPLAISLDSFDIDKIAHETEGRSFEDLNALVRKAFQRAKIMGTSLSQELLEEAIDTEIRNIIFDSSKQLPENEQNLLAVHQAGHTLVASLLDIGQQMSKVTIRPVLAKLKEELPWDAHYKDDNEKQKTIEHGKIFLNHNHDTLQIFSRERKINLCKMNLAGHIAEEVLLGSCGYSHHTHDTEQALQIAKSIVFEGLVPERLSKNKQDELFDKSFELLNACKAEVRQLLEQHKETLARLTKALKEELTLDAAQVAAIINPVAAAAQPSQATTSATQDDTAPKTDLYITLPVAPQAA